MHSINSKNMVPIHVFSFVIFSYLVQLCFTARHGKCPCSFDCGNFGNVYFPFTNTERPDCGLLTIHNCEDRDPGAPKIIKNNGKWLNVANVTHSTIFVQDIDLRDLLLSRSCAAFNKSSIFSSNSRFFSTYIEHNVTLLRCNLHTPKLSLPMFFSNSTLCTNKTIYYSYSYSQLEFVSTNYKRYFETCSLFQLPKSSQDLQPDAPVDLFNFVSDEYVITVEVTPECSSCHHLKGGQCQLENNFKFFCAQEQRKSVLVPTVTSVTGALGLLMILAFCFRRYFCNKGYPSHQIIETFLKQHGRLAAKRYSYVDVKKMTNSFRNKLGQGGYGSVYKGKLRDGSLVAVKLLGQLKGNGEEFINEVDSISMTSHVNIVCLLGFCLEGSKRALIYEYMPNGSVENFIYEEKDKFKFNCRLTCKTMYNIVIGVARGLEYLHRDCSTRILHFDIKPHNILLDEDFHPKISDIGIAKICLGKQSTISLLDARGTAGYIAPKVFSRRFGRVSHKSDVYSYGMMVLEIVGARESNNIKVDCSSDIYFPTWIYKRFETNEDLGLQCIKNESDKETVKKMIMVSFWCIQTDPSNRPAMSRVVEMLEGNIESLQVPPKPFLSSPTTSPRNYSTETCETV